MGIQGLLPLLKDIQKPVHVSSYAGKTLGVDAYVWLHRGAYGCAREIVLGDPTPRYIAHALSRIRMLQHFGVKPYLVFDGDKLPAKSGTEDDREQRRADNLQRASELEQQGKMQQARDVYAKCVDITPEMAFQLIKVLKDENIPYVVAPYEADAQLAFLEAHNIIDGVITEDSDLLVFGCKTVLFKLDQAGNAVEMLQSRFWTNRHIALSGWTPVEFRQMAILSGCDYLPSIVGMGLKNAHRLLRRYKTVDKVLQAVRLEGKMRVPQTYSREFRKAELTFVHQRVFDPRTQKLVTLTPLPDGTHDDMLPFIGASMDDEVARQVADGSVDPITRTRIVDRVPKPLSTRSSSMNNVASSSAVESGMHGLHRSSTAPTGLGAGGGGGGGGGGFYKASVGAVAKKKVSNEKGLQSLNRFFKEVKGDGASGKMIGSSSSSIASGSGSGAQKEGRKPLGDLDTNRAQQPAPLKQEVAEAKPTISKFFSRAKPTVAECPVSTQDAQLDHAYLHLGGQLTPPKPRQDSYDPGCWDDECDDMHDFVKSSSPPRAPSVAPESQPLVMDTQELWQTQRMEGGGGSSAVATQLVESGSNSSAVVVVPQTPSRASRKRMHSGLSECDAGLSSPESAIGSGFISSPASSSVRGGEGSSKRRLSVVDGEEMDQLASASQDGEEEKGEVELGPVTPLAMRGSARRPMLHTSASVAKLEAFRYTHTPTQQPQQQQERGTVLRRATEGGASPSVLKMAASRTPVASRPGKILKRSPTLLFVDGERETGSCEGGTSGRGLFDRFRFQESL